MPGGTGRRREASQIREASPSASEGSREVPGGAGRRTALILMSQGRLVLAVRHCESHCNAGAVKVDI